MVVLAQDEQLNRDEAGLQNLRNSGFTGGYIWRGDMREVLL